MKRYIILIFIVLILLIYKINNYYTESSILINKHKPTFINFLETNLNNDKSKLFFIPYLELGDTIVTNGIVRFYCSHYDKVIIPCRKSYFNQVSFMYRDLKNLIIYILPDKNIYTNINKYIPYDDDIKKLFQKYNINLVVLGCYNYYFDIEIKEYNLIPNVFPLLYNLELGLDPSIMYTHFKVIRDFHKEEELYNKLVNIIGFKYIILIDDEKRNLLVNDKYLNHLPYPVFKLGNNSYNINEKLNTIQDPIIFNYIKILENASEIISIDSSIPWLIDMLDIQTKTTVHTYMRAGIIKFNNKKISVIDGSTIDRLPGYFNSATINSRLCNIFN